MTGRVDILVWVRREDLEKVLNAVVPCTKELTEATERLKKAAKDDWVITVVPSGITETEEGE